MRTQLLSDLHLEYHADGGRRFVEQLDPTGVDLLILAGDVASAPHVPFALELLCRRYARADVVYVLGNHEYYGLERSRVRARLAEPEQRLPNLVWLERRARQRHGRRFLGTTLWFGCRPPERDRARLNCFRRIADLDSWVYEESRRSVEFLERELRPGDVVVSHFLPSVACLAHEHASAPHSRYFVNAVDELLKERCPELWVHGHTHSSVDIMVGHTRVVCNPYGYARRDINRAFDRRHVFEL